MSCASGFFNFIFLTVLFVEIFQFLLRRFSSHLDGFRRHHNKLNVQGFRSAVVVLVFVVVFLDLFFRNLDVFHIGGRIKAHRTNDAGFAKNVV